MAGNHPRLTLLSTTPILAINFVAFFTSILLHQFLTFIPIVTPSENIFVFHVTSLLFTPYLLQKKIEGVSDYVVPIMQLILCALTSPEYKVQEPWRRLKMYSKYLGLRLWDPVCPSLQYHIEESDTGTSPSCRTGMA
jgi:hypothetical protein